MHAWFANKGVIDRPLRRCLCAERIVSKSWDSWRWTTLIGDRDQGEQFNMGRDMSVVKADEVQSFTPEPGMVRQVLAHNRQLMLVRHFFEKGWVGARHSHPHEQLVYVVNGKIHVDVDGRTFDVGAGESFVVDGGVEHQAWALEESEVLDVFTPMRDEYKALVS